MLHHTMEGSRLLGEPHRPHSPNGDVHLHFLPPYPQPPPPTGSSSTSYVPGGAGGSAPLPPAAETSPTPMWMHYDPYHGASYTLELPKGGSPVRSNSPNPYSSGGESADEDNLQQYPYFEGSEVDRHLLFLQGTRIPEYRLNYHDFLPEFSRYDRDVIVCNETFGDVVERANSWLKQNPHIHVTSCETVTWTATDPIMIGDSETVILDRCSCPSSETDSYHVTGMRMWFSSRAPAHVQHNNNEGPGFDSKSIGYRDYVAGPNETLTTFLQSINSDLGKNWLQGSILSINSVFIPENPAGQQSAVVWKESESVDIRHRLLLRVFYNRGDVCRQLIGIKDIIPEHSKGNWETFSLLMKKSTNWIRQETSVHVTNLQSMYVTRNQDTDSAKESADQSCQSFRECSTHQSFQLLRLYYVGRREHASTSQNDHHVINCMTFTPVQTTLGPNTEADFERMRQTMSRISAWLDLAGATIRSAETFITPVSSSLANHTLPEMAVWTPLMVTSSRSANVQKYLMHIRIYLEGDFSDPDPQLLPPLPYSLTAALQSTIQEREYKKYYSQKKTRKRRRKITLLVFLAIVLVAVGIIICDQLFNIFKRFN